jgi:hypothetical protein
VLLDGFAARDAPISGWAGKDVPRRPQGQALVLFAALLNLRAYPTRKRDRPSIAVALPVNS